MNKVDLNFLISSFLRYYNSILISLLFQTVLLARSVEITTRSSELFGNADNPKLVVNIEFVEEFEVVNGKLDQEDLVMRACLHLKRLQWEKTRIS